MLQPLAEARDRKTIKHMLESSILKSGHSPVPLALGRWLLLLAGSPMVSALLWKMHESTCILLGHRPPSFKHL